MISLSSDQYEFVYFFYYLLDTIEEGFDYIIESYISLEHSEAEVILNDIFLAFYHIDSSNPILLNLFDENPQLIETLQKFDGIISELEQKLTIFGNIHQNKDYIINIFFPDYLSWKESVQIQLKPHIAH